MSEYNVETPILNYINLKASIMSAVKNSIERGSVNNFDLDKNISRALLEYFKEVEKK